MADKKSQSAFFHEEKDNLTKEISFLTNTYKQFANKPIQDCIKDGFSESFLCCQNPQATESSINADVYTSEEPGRSYLQATDGLGPFSFPSSYGEYTTLQIRVIYNYAPDDELPHCIFNVTQTGTSIISQ